MASPNMILSLQRTAGNRAVASLLAPAVQRVAGTKAGQMERLVVAVGQEKADWISAHPTERVNLWVNKKKDDLAAFKAMAVADFKLAFPVPGAKAEAMPAAVAASPVSPGPESPAPKPPAPAAKPPAPTPLSPQGASPAVALPPAGTPIPAPIAVALPPPSTPVPEPITPESQFAKRLADFKVALAAAKVAEDDKGRLVMRTASTVFGRYFTFSDVWYKSIYDRIPGIREVKAELAKITSDVDTHAADPSLPPVRKLDMITFYENQLLAKKATLAKVEPTALSAANALATSTSARYNATPKPDDAAVLKFLTGDVKSHTVNVGTRYADYRSSFDLHERNSFGAEFDLEHTPLVLHIHARGKGTDVHALSVKEGKRSVVPNGWIKDSFRANLLQSLARAPENPITIGKDRFDGIPAPGRTGI